MDKFIDLHAHSNLSDGALTPKQLVNKAADLGLAAIALTDHDLIDGLDEALAAGQKRKIEVIPGIEMTSYEGEKEFHILGYFIDYSDQDLQHKLKVVQEGRVVRAKKTVQKLNELGFHVSFEEVAALAAGAIGRPHLAMAPIKNPGNHDRLINEFGHLPTTGEFIQKYISEDKPAYVRRESYYEPAEALAEIKRLGGVSSLAHPGWEMADCSDPENIKFKDEDLEWLTNLGLDAVEVYAHYNDKLVTKKLVGHFEKRAEALNLLKTGGSDYHGFGSAGMELGFSNFYLKVPYVLLADLKLRAKK